MEVPVQVGLFVEILNRYLLYFDKGCEQVRAWAHVAAIAICAC